MKHMNSRKMTILKLSLKKNLDKRDTKKVLSLIDKFGEDNLFPVYKFKNFIIFEKMEAECNYFKLFDTTQGKFIRDLNKCYNAVPH
jgi:hypothetical protein